LLSLLYKWEWVICNKSCERKREREGDRNVKVQVLDFWLLAFGRSFCGFVFGEEKKSFYLGFFLCFVFWDFFCFVLGVSFCVL
jgi:hypothetical protein